MRYIKKQKTPQEFLEWKAQVNEDWQPSWDDLKNPEKNIVRQSLLKEQGHICCYCQRRIDLNNSHIEHFKPKDENYYPELSLEYTNFLASCQKEKINIETNEEKIREYGEIPVHCGHAKGNWYDEKLTVSPLIQNCADYFLYTEAVEILPSEDPDKNEAAKVTIEKLGLDKLNDKRQAVIKGLFGEEKLSKEEIEIFINNLDQRNPEDQYDEFCNVLIYVLKQYI